MSSSTTILTLLGNNITSPLTAEQEAALMAALNATLGSYNGVTYSIGDVQVTLTSRAAKGCEKVLAVGLHLYHEDPS